MRHNWIYSIGSWICRSWNTAQRTELLEIHYLSVTKGEDGYEMMLSKKNVECEE